jgi:hypothetical protein
MVKHNEKINGDNKKEWREYLGLMYMSSCFSSQILYSYREGSM